MKKTILLSLAASSLLFAEHNHEHEGHGTTPSVTLIGDFSYVNRNKELHETYIDGFTHAHAEGEDHGHDHSEPHANEGFNFNSAELEIAAPIDDMFKVQSTFHLSEDSFEVEELYGLTQNRDGFNLKAGKFLSSFGANNAKHSEMWDFANQPLINNALFGYHGLNEKGIGASWNNKNFKIGLEVLTGENEQSLGSSEIEYGDGNISIEGSEKPELNVMYAKYSDRIDTTKIDAGLSYASGKARWDHTDDDEPHALTGDVKFYGADVAFTFPLTRTSNIKWSTEYIQRKITNGTRYAADTTTKSVETDQSGINTQLVYTINPQWKTGIQYDDIIKNDKIVDGANKNKSEDLKRTSFMVEHALSEHNRVRVQYNNDKSKYHDEALLSYNDVVFQWIFEFSTGEHNHNH
ncbi:MAG: hypothetical protein IE909_02160 [Campylobacterales bacterium]|nr:hypothetical protein [Campylobacterales bacterium]